MRCLYCGKELALLKRWTSGGEFCSDAHRQQYQEEYTQLALNRLLQAKPLDPKPKAGAKVPETPAESKPVLQHPAPRLNRPGRFRVRRLAPLNPSPNRRRGPRKRSRLPPRPASFSNCPSRSPRQPRSWWPRTWLSSGGLSQNSRKARLVGTPCQGRASPPRPDESPCSVPSRWRTRPPASEKENWNCANFFALHPWPNSICARPG